MVAIAGEIRPSKAAERLKVHYRTVMRWCHQRVAGEPSPLQYVRRDIVGGYYLRADEVAELERKLVEEPADFS